MTPLSDMTSRPPATLHILSTLFKAALKTGCLLLLCTGGRALYAQERDPVLPDLAPREVEIRGRLEIAFPSLHRQPLVGFNPPPRVPEVRGRHPFVEAYKQESADLPPSPLQRPTPPAVSSLAGAAPLRGEFEAGAGRFLSRIVRADVGIPISDGRSFSLNLDYRGSDGSTPFTRTPDIKNPFDALEFDAGVKTTFSDFEGGVGLDGFFENYTLFGTERTLKTGLAPHPDREGRSAGARLWVKTRPSSPYQLAMTLHYGATRFRTDVFTSTSNNDVLFRRLEHRLDLSTRVAIPFQDKRWSMDAALSTSGLDTGGLLGRTVQVFDAGSHLAFGLHEIYQIKLGARIFGFNAIGQTPSGGDRRAGYLSPEIRVDAYPRQGLNLYAQNSPGAEPYSLGDLYKANPYLVDEPLIQPTLRTVDAEVGGRIFKGPVQLAGFAGYRFMPNYRFFEQTTGRLSRLYTRGLTDVSYARARVYRGGVDLSVVLSEGFHTTLGLTYQDGRLTKLDTGIPYFPSLLGRAMLSYAFAGHDGLIQLNGHLESPRYRDRARVVRVPTYADVDAMISYYFTPWVGVSVRAENLISGSTERWDHYPESPALFQGTLRIRW